MEIIQLLLENKDLLIQNWKEVFESNKIENIEKQSFFISRINEFDFDVFKQLLTKLNFNEKLLKVINKKGGYHSIRLEDTEFNRALKDYLIVKDVIEENILNKIFSI